MSSHTQFKPYKNIVSLCKTNSWQFADELLRENVITIYSSAITATFSRKLSNNWIFTINGDSVMNGDNHKGLEKGLETFYNKLINL